MSERIQNSSLEKMLIEREDALWGTLRNKHPEQFSEFYEQFSKFFADDYHGVYAYGITTKPEEIEGTRWCDLQKYSITEVKVIFPANDTAVVVYKIVTENFAKGQDISGSFNSSSVWVNRSDQWQLILHTEARINT